jgi:hypothetical protein
MRLIDLEFVLRSKSRALDRDSRIMAPSMFIRDHFTARVNRSYAESSPLKRTLPGKTNKTAEFTSPQVRDNDHPELFDWSDDESRRLVTHEQGWSHYDEPNLMISNGNII